ncbi:sodium-dependent glucose transporter 1A-like protein [Dinothrombium tinctorium]|uniref:Sodium-dependent glucose transporter 1A-like protein n=1 Tax=Dinothrombium tinctorium TaxID=1965070 RepID=A0A3S3QA75_9ACAR|nr:sodium-dependent glucose transporter 1A-like protein [Dinothrombium tinctorium]RWS06163.1 sodium-dependent glucose transporter 1A-like protein [Dinothrombium tinctorium]RWS06180.1 sodium-dependent glucose transporter 1A-like protein [Dinothrombium tinctorium]
MKSPLKRKNNLDFVKTYLVGFIFFYLGLITAIQGTTLLDLRIAVQTSLENVMKTVPLRSLSFALGGFLTKHIKIELLMVICLTIAGILSALTPWNTTIYGLIACISVSGVTAGIIEVAGNYILLRIWKEKSAPLLQVLYFFFGLGAFVAPLITEPFLLPLHENHNSTLDLSNATVVKNYTPNDLKIQYPYGMIGVYCVLLAFVFFIVAHKYSGEKKKEMAKESTKCEETNAFSPKLKYLVVGLSALLIHFYFGVEFVAGTVLMPFAVQSSLHLQKSTAAFMTSIYWGIYTFFRLIAVVLTKKVSAHFVITLELVFLICGCIGLIAGLKSISIFWTGLVFVAIGVSTLFSTLLGYLQLYFQITSKMLSLLFVVGCLGEFLYPFIAAMFIDVYPNIFLVIISLASAMMSVLYIAISFLLRKPKNQNNTIITSYFYKMLK